MFSFYLMFSFPSLRINTCKCTLNISGTFFIGINSWWVEWRFKWNVSSEVGTVAQVGWCLHSASDWDLHSMLFDCQDSQLGHFYQQPEDDRNISVFYTPSITHLQIIHDFSSLTFRSLLFANTAAMHLLL